jgi:hypothetical protein|nr:MAG TPA: hypothetical protein [Bacteriophage sp.]
MQPYVNPYYLQQNQQGYPQYYNPLAQVQNRAIDYQQNMPNTYQQNQIVQGINGKIIAEMSQITANDVPMDGSVAFFPKQDLSEVYAKSWNADGTIRTVTYKPVLDNEPKNVPTDTEKLKCDLSDEATQGIMDKFEEISDRLGQLEKSLQSQRKTSQSQRKDD